MMRRIVVILILLIVLSLAIGCQEFELALTGEAGLSQPVWSPDGDRIAFISFIPEEGEAEEENDYFRRELWIMNADGTDLKRIVSERNQELNLLGIQPPAWSPDGKRIAYVLEDDLWIIDVDRGEQRQLTSDIDVFFLNFWPPNSIWSPDGKKIAISSSDSDEEKCDLWIVDTETGERKMLIRVEKGIILPSYSSTGDRIAYLSGNEDNIELWSMDKEGGDMILLVGIGDEEREGSSDFLPPFSLSWSPDGKEIALSIFLGKEEDGRVQVEVWAVEAKGGGLRNITDTRFFDEMYPIWSPEGESIIYFLWDKELEKFFPRIISKEGKHKEALIIGLDTKLLVQSLRESSPLLSFSWSPDRQKIAYVYEGNIWIMGKDISQPRQLTFFKEEIFEEDSE